MTKLVTPEPEWVVPKGWVIDHLARLRLLTQLDVAPSGVAGVIAPAKLPEPGGSYRTCAEWSALEQLSAAYISDSAIAGVALVRPGTAHSVEAGTVVLERGSWLIDPGASSHDPMAPVEPIESADPHGRSPFPRRPIVLFIGTEADRGRAVWARNLVNELLELEVEARLATAYVPDGPHFTRPCHPGPRTIQALRPDVVVALDETVLDEVSSWCDRRSTVIVHHTGERTLETELVPWRIGDASGRVRAFIGSATTASQLARLCNRLCSGPLPAPPVVETDQGGSVVAAPKVRTRTTVLRRSITLIQTEHASSGDGRLGRFMTEAAALGQVASVVAPEDAGAAAAHDVVILASGIDPTVATELVRERSLRGQTTIAELDTAGAAMELALECGAAFAPNEEMRAEAEREGVAARTLPLLLTRAALESLRQSRVVVEHDAPVVGVRVDQDGGSAHALITTIESLLDTSDELRIDWVGDATTLPSRFRDDPRVTIEHDRPFERCASWTVQAWAGSIRNAQESGRPDALTHSSYLGIPTVFDAACRGDLDDHLISRWALPDTQQPEPWIRALRAVLDAPDDAREGLEQRADLLFGPRASSRIVTRLVGWASFGWADR